MHLQYRHTILSKTLLVLFLAFVFCLCACKKPSNIKISEVCINPLTDYKGEEGSWIELYNAGNEATFLSNYYLTDRLNKKKWRIPNVSLASNERILIFADGNEKKEVLIPQNAINRLDTWTYKPLDEWEKPVWSKADFDDSDWATGKAGFGFGDKDDQTKTKGKYGVCIRKKFDLDGKDLASIDHIKLSIDYDDAFIAWLNGVEIARSDNAEKINSQKPFPTSTREARKYKGGEYEEYDIPQNVLKKAIRTDENVLVIQGINYKLTSSDLSLIPILQIFNAVPIENHEAWKGKTEAFFHTNFSLKKGETLYLLNKKGAVADSLEIQPTNANHSIVKHEGQSLFCSSPTPLAANDISAATPCYADKPKLSADSGIYDQSFWLKSKSNNQTLRYTLDGTLPNLESPVFPDSLLIDKTQTIRIAAFNNDCLPSRAKNYTYFINSTHSLPIFSIITEPDNLWNEEDGIYSMGKFADKEHPYKGANFYDGREVPAHITFFDNRKMNADKKPFKQDIGLRIHGGGSRSRSMKSLRLTARKKYGKSRLKHPFFEDKDIEERKIILLKNAGQNFNETHLIDAFLHRIIAELGTIETQTYQPCIVYINGEYWGVHNIREKIGKHYITEHYQLDSEQTDSIDILGGNGTVYLEGENKSFKDLSDFIFDNDMGKPENFERFSNAFDIENYLDYFITYIYTINKDWRRINNVKFWRHDDLNEGKWRFFLVDADMTLGKRSEVTENHLEFVWENGFRHFRLFEKMIDENRAFRNQFILRYQDLMNTVFAPQNMLDKLDPLVEALDPEMPKHFDKWTIRYKDFEASYSKWKNHYISGLKTFIKKRPQIARQHLTDHFALGQMHSLILNIEPPLAGTVQLNSIKLDAFPFNGLYFEESKLTAKATPNEGYVFSHWELNNEKINKPSIDFYLEKPSQLKAVFVEQ